MTQPNSNAYTPLRVAPLKFVAPHLPTTWSPAPRLGLLTEDFDASELAEIQSFASMTMQRSARPLHQLGTQLDLPLASHEDKPEELATPKLRPVATTGLKRVADEQVTTPSAKATRASARLEKKNEIDQPRTKVKQFELAPMPLSAD